MPAAHTAEVTVGTDRAALLARLPWLNPRRVDALTATSCHIQLGADDITDLTRQVVDVIGRRTGERRRGARGGPRAPGRGGVRARRSADRLTRRPAAHSMSKTRRAVLPTIAWAFSTVVAANTASMALRV
jgi:hypothetical protein